MHLLLHIHAPRQPLLLGNKFLLHLPYPPVPAPHLRQKLLPLGFLSCCLGEGHLQFRLEEGHFLLVPFYDSV